MTETKVASRYAKSLLELAQEQGIADAVNNDMLLVADTIGASRDLANLLNNPTVRSDKKQSILKELFGSKINKLSLSFILLVAKKRRDSYLFGIARQYSALYKQTKGIETVVVTSAIGLDDKLRKEVYEVLKKSTSSEIELIERVDKSLIGGFVLRVGDRQYDASILKSLNRFNKELLSSTYARQN